MGAVRRNHEMTVVNGERAASRVFSSSSSGVAFLMSELTLS